MEGAKWQFFHCTHLLAKDKVGTVTVMNRKPGQRSSRESPNSETYGSDNVIMVSLRNTGGQHNKFLLDLYEIRSSRSIRQKSNFNHQNRVTFPQFPDLSLFADVEYLE